MPKPKAFLQSKNKKKKDEPVCPTPPEPESLVDQRHRYLRLRTITKQVGLLRSSRLDVSCSQLIAGVDFEEAAGKHRAGDAVKSLRFFQRAINTYDEGLVKYPQSFDLAYNKARVQYEVATHPKLAKELRQPLVDLLKIALASHEYALRIDENDADLLFNTSQVLTSIAEELANAGSTEEAIKLLRSALRLQARCLSTQEQRYSETLEQEKEARQILEEPRKQDDITEEMDGIEHSDKEPTTEGQEQWASVLEPVTADTIIDTICACFGTMTTLCTTIGTSRYLLWRELSEELQSQYMQLVSKMQDLSSADPARIHEAALADAILQSAMFDLAFVLDQVLSAARYKSMLNGLWSTNQPHLDLENSVDAPIAHANALITFNFSLSTAQNAFATELQTELANYRWAALNQAIKSLTKASSIPSISVDEKAKTHLLRGDASLLQYRMSSPAIHPQAVANAAALLKNAQVFYRNAAQLSSDQGDKEHALFRCAVVQSIQDPDGADRPALGAIFADEQERRVGEELQDMLDEGLVLEQTDANGTTSYV
jgi:hypothetical protein